MRKALALRPRSLLAASLSVKGGTGDALGVEGGCVVATEGGGVSHDVLLNCRPGLWGAAAVGAVGGQSERAASVEGS